MSELNNIALKIIGKGKGILAADESTGTMTKRLESVNVPSTPENRLLFRETLFSSDGMKKCIGGVILYDETIKQISNSKKLIPELISNSGAIPGIKVDTGVKKLALSDNETITEGLDGLSERLKEYYDLGARFTKWRAVIKIGSGMPTEECINGNADALAQYAKLAQNHGLVPIVEPEVLMDGNHSINECFNASANALSSLFNSLKMHEVNLKGVLLKPSMVTAGSLAETQASPQEVAELTIKCLKENVPSEVPGITFLSGGQTEIQATEHLDLMNKIGGFDWKLSFSYGRALQAGALKAWSGKPENKFIAQDVLSHRAKMNKLAALGEWNSELED